MEMTLYTVSVYTENRVGLLNQISNTFTRRRLNIETLNVSPSSIEGIHRFTITTWCESDTEMQKLVAQIEKRVDVVRAFYYTDDELIHQEIALYKVQTEKLLDNTHVEELIRRHNARILEIHRAYIVIEKTGQQEETQALFEELSSLCGVMQFVRSGRVAITRSPIEKVSEFLNNQERRKEEALR